jgi:signal transduction histidine kinase
MQLRNCFLLLFFSLLQGNGLIAQRSLVDSLKQRINQLPQTGEKLNAIMELSEQGINADTLLLYVTVAEKIAAQTKQPNHLDIAAYCRANYYIRKNFSDSASVVIDRLLIKYEAAKQQSPFYLRLLFFKAKVFDRANQFTQALSQLVEVIQVAEQMNDTLIQIQAKTGIGWVQLEMEQYNEALAWLHKAKATSTNKALYKNYGALYSNLANTHHALGNMDSAVYYINTAIQDARENNNLGFLATALSIQAKILIDMNQPAQAELPLRETLKIREQLNDPFYTVYDMSSLARYYASNGQPQKGIALCKQGILLAKQSGLSSQLLMMYHALAENYKVAGNTMEYSHTLEEIIALKDSFNTINSTKLIADLQANAETQKKEKQILEQKLVLTQKNYLLYGSALFVLMMSIIAWLSFKEYRRKEKLKMEKALEQQQEITSHAIMDAAEQERKRIAADLHDNLGAYAAAIVSNVDQIKMQHESETAFNQLTMNSQSMVSELNDTIWVLKKDSLSLTAISDRVKTFVQRIAPSYPAINIEVKEQIENDRLLSAGHAFQLYQIIKEAIINALKHGKAQHVVVSFKSGDQWEVIIADNGKGMDPNEIDNPKGNGVLNMRSRSKDAGWKLSFLSTTLPGTVVLIESAGSETFPEKPI